MSSGSEIILPLLDASKLRTRAWSDLESVGCGVCSKTLLCKRVKREDAVRDEPSSGRKSRAGESKKALCRSGRFLIFEPETVMVYNPPGAFVDYWWPGEALKFYSCEKNPHHVHGFKGRRIETSDELAVVERAAVKVDPATTYLEAVLSQGPISAAYIREVWGTSPWSLRKLLSAKERLNVRDNQGVWSLDPPE